MRSSPHIWTHPGIARQKSVTTPKGCDHISGLEDEIVRGSRALMELRACCPSTRGRLLKAEGATRLAAYEFDLCCHQLHSVFANSGCDRVRKFCRASGRCRESGALGVPNGPQATRIFVGERHGGFIDSATCGQLLQPPTQRIGFPGRTSQHRTRPVDQKHAQVRIPALADSQQQRFTPAGVLTGHDPQRSADLPAVSEVRGIANRRSESRSGQRTDAVNRSCSARHGRKRTLSWPRKFRRRRVIGRLSPRWRPCFKEQTLRRRVQRCARSSEVFRSLRTPGSSMDESA
jgi:hypothetical protein